MSWRMLPNRHPTQVYRRGSGVKRGSFLSIEDLQKQMLAFIGYFNRTMAKPFK